MEINRHLSPRENELERCLKISKFLTPSLISAAKNSKWVILGGTGFVGKWLTMFGQELSRETQNASLITVATRNVKSAEVELRKFLPKQYPLPNLIQLSDLEDTSKFLKIMKDVDTIFHAATPTNDVSHQILKVLKTTEIVLRNCGLISRPRFIHLSSGGVYERNNFVGKLVPEGSSRVKSEDAVNFYQRVKIEIEELVENASKLGLINGVNPRLFAFGGPGFPIESNYAFAEFMRSALKGESIKIRGNPQSHRSYLHPIDMTVSILAVWENIDRLVDLPIHIGSSIPISLQTLAKEIALEFDGINIDILSKGSQAVEWYVPETLVIRNLGYSMEHSTIPEIIKSWRNFLAPQQSVWH